jgi:hypothetical protein
LLQPSEILLLRRSSFRQHGLVLVGLAAMFANWRNALVRVKPETLRRWHRDLFRRFWTRCNKSKTPQKPRLAARVIALIKQMATENKTWGAKRNRGTAKPRAGRPLG